MRMSGRSKGAVQFPVHAPLFAALIRRKKTRLFVTFRRRVFSIDRQRGVRQW
jgi:hypothetical protein